ncbi:MAG: OmpH family outer membrane protein [Planctomycetota bacterium]|jgi:Skp family chaperone for outer membrane proteins
MKAVRVPLWMIMGAFIGLVAFHAGARGSGGGLMAAPTAVATVDLNRALNGLQKHAAMEANLRQVVLKLTDEHKALEDGLKNLQQVAASSNDPVQKRTLEEELARKLLEYDVRLKYDADVLDVERALLFKDLYNSICKSIAQMAVSEGYDVVLVDDSGSELNWNPNAQVTREMQVQQQIAARRMLYRGSVIDVTDALVQRMNNDFEMGR